MLSVGLQPTEVILYEGAVKSNVHKGNLLITLTSLQLVFEKEKGIFKKERELVYCDTLDNVKVYNNEVQVKQKATDVTIQTVEMNITISFSGILEAKKFVGKLVNTVTGTTVARRGSDRIKEAFNIVDDTLGIDSRGTVKGLIENGVKGTIINGIGQKK